MFNQIFGLAQLPIGIAICIFFNDYDCHRLTSLHCATSNGFGNSDSLLTKKTLFYLSHSNHSYHHSRRCTVCDS